VYDERFASRYGAWRGVVERTLFAFVDCGIEEHGLARVRCDARRRHFAGTKPRDRHWSWRYNFVLVVAAVFAVANIPRCLYWGRPGQAFASSRAVILCLVAPFGLALYPNQVMASNDAAKQGDDLQRRRA
jgi:hypothetical protein